MNGFASAAVMPGPTGREHAFAANRQAPQIFYLRDVAQLLGYRYSYVRLVASDAARIEPVLPASVHDNFPRLHRFGRRWGIYAPHFHRWLQKRIKTAERLE